MQQVADLLAAASEADVGKRGLKWWLSIQCVNTPWSTFPICQGPAITPQRSIDRCEAEDRPVLLDQELGGQLGRPVEGPRPGQGNSSAMPAADAPGRGWLATSSNRVSALARCELLSAATG